MLSIKVVGSVYFDDFVVTINQGNIIEENHYYSFGLKIAAISSKKYSDSYDGKINNPFLYNGKEMLDDDADLNWYDYGFRSYDPQIGRFMQLDPLTDSYPLLTPYQYASNDPITNVDIDGLEGGGAVSATKDFVYGFTSISSGTGLVLGAMPVATSLAKQTGSFLNILGKTLTYLTKGFEVSKIITNGTDTHQVGNIYIGGSINQKKEILNMLRQITNDDLRVNEKTSILEIKFKTGNKLSKPLGTELIRDILSTGKNLTIRISQTKDLPGAITDFNDWTNASNGIGSDATIDFGNVHRTLDANPKGGNALWEMMPKYIMLVHELSHALTGMDGYTVPVRKGNVLTHSFKNAIGQLEYETSEKEELFAVGIYSRPGNRKRSSYISENDVRNENKINARLAHNALPYGIK